MCKSEAHSLQEFTPRTPETPTPSLCLPRIPPAAEALSETVSFHRGFPQSRGHAARRRKNESEGEAPRRPPSTSDPGLASG